MKRRCNTKEDGDRFPVYSPDGNQVAFVSTRNSKSKVYLMNLNDLKPRSVTGDDSNSYDPAWSPDGKKIAFASDKECRTYANLYIIRHS